MRRPVLRTTLPVNRGIGRIALNNYRVGIGSHGAYFLCAGADAVTQIATYLHVAPR